MSETTAPQIYVSNSVPGYETPMIGSTPQKHVGSNGVPLPDITPSSTVITSSTITASSTVTASNSDSVSSTATESVPTENENWAFWEVMKKLNWADRSDKRITWTVVDNSTLNLSDDVVANMQRVAGFIRKDLESSLNKLEFFTALAPQEQLDLVSHIIARGKEFYDFVVSEPSICAYLVDGSEYQACPLFDLNKTI